MLSYHQILLPSVVVGLTVTPIAHWKLSIHPPRAPSTLGFGLSDKAYRWARGGLVASGVIALLLSIAALGLSTGTGLQTWMGAAERSACVSLVFAEASVFFFNPLFVYDANTSQCVYTSLILLSGQPWLFYGVCICSFLNPLLSFLPPTLECLDYTDHNEWYTHLPAILLGLIICVIQVLLLLRQIWPENKSASDTQRSRIICCFVAILEAIAFLVLIGFFFHHKRVYEDLPVVFCSRFLMVHFTD